MAGIKTQNLTCNTVLIIFIFVSAILLLRETEAAGIGAVTGSQAKPLGGGEVADGTLDGVTGSGSFKCSGGFDVYFVLDRYVVKISRILLYTSLKTIDKTTSRF